MKKYDIRVEGGTGLTELRELDVNIVDAAEEDQGFVDVSAGLWCVEMWRISEFFTTSGERRVQWVTGEWQQQIEDEIGYENPIIKERAAGVCISHIESMITQVEMREGGLGGLLRHSVRIGALAVVPPSEDEEELAFYLALVVDVQGTEKWDEELEIVVEYLDPINISDDHAKVARGEVADRVWADSAKGKQLWARFPDAEDRKELTRKVAASTLLPVATKPLQHLCREGETLQGWMIDERPLYVKHWLKGYDDEKYGWSSTQVHILEADEEWEFEGIEELVGFSDYGAAALSWSTYMAEVRELVGGKLEELILRIYSDGSFINGHTPKASYGWVIWGFEGHRKVEEVEGGGVVHGGG